MRGEQHALPLGLDRGRVGGGLAGVLALHGLGPQGAAGEGLDVEDQRDAPSPRTVAPEYRPIDLSCAAERLDDDLLGVEHAVDDQAEPPALGAQHRDDDVAVVPVAGQVEHVGEPDERQQVAAQAVDLRAADLLDGGRGLLGVERRRAPAG